MARRRKAMGPVGFMPSDGRFLGSRDLHGIPAGPDAERMPILITEVAEYDKGEVVNGKAMKAFTAIAFDRQPKAWLLKPWPKPDLSKWETSAKEWKVGPEVIMRIAFRLGTNFNLWEGCILPVRLEVTSFGRDDVWGVRPVPMAWESDREQVRAAMKAIAADDYRAPGLPQSSPVKEPKREPGDDDPDEPPGDWPGHDEQANES